MDGTLRHGGIAVAMPAAGKFFVFLLMALDIDSGTRLRALVVDGDMDTAATLSCLLQIVGCKAAVAFGACMATRVAELFQPTLVLLDQGVLGESGSELVRALRALGDPLSHALFVCLAGKEDGQQAQRWLSAGCDHVVCKPLQSHQLADLLTRAQEQREVQGCRAGEGRGQRPWIPVADGRPAPA